MIDQQPIPNAAVAGCSDSATGGRAAASVALQQRLRAMAAALAAGERRPIPPIGVDAALSRAVVLMMRSPEHARLTVAELEWLLLPPITLRQFKLYNAGLLPIAFAAWGKFSEAIEVRFRTGGYRLTPPDWQSGERLTLVHMITPLGGRDAVLQDLQRTVLAGAGPTLRDVAQ